MYDYAYFRFCMYKKRESVIYLLFVTEMFNFNQINTIKNNIIPFILFCIMV